MLLNRDNPMWDISDEQYLTPDRVDEINERYEQHVRETLTSDVREMGYRLYNMPKPSEDESTGSRTGRIIITVLVIGAIVGIVVSLFMKNIRVALCLFAGIFLFAGIYTLITGMSGKGESASKRLMNRLLGGFMVLMSAPVIIIEVFMNDWGMAQKLLWIMIFMFGSGGLWMIAHFLIGNILASRITYTEDINATCAGYVRKIETSNSGDGGGSFRYMYVSPIFNYFYDGERYEAVYDDFVIGQDSDIALGQTVPIRIDPRHPEGIMSPATKHKGAAVFGLIMGILFLGATGFMVYWVLSGNVSDNDMTVEWNPLIENAYNEEEETVPTEPTLPQVTDEWLEETFASTISGKDWYVETATVASYTTEEDGFIVTFDNDTMMKAMVHTEPKVGDTFTVFYTIVDENLEYGQYYKALFTYFTEGEGEYVGSHTAYQG